MIFAQKCPNLSSVNHEINASIYAKNAIVSPSDYFNVFHFIMIKKLVTYKVTTLKMETIVNKNNKMYSLTQPNSDITAN